jgi:tRNA/rRNA methyltransferase
MTPVTDFARFVLVRPSHAGNVGAAARAIQVMGFDDLVLVAPRQPDLHQQPEAVALASGATDVLAGVRVVPTLAEALAGVTRACATAMTPRDFGPAAVAPRERMPALVAGGQRVAFVFGTERTGMANEDVWRCHEVLSIPANPAGGSLNLAQAVQVIAYEWRQALGGFPIVAAAPALAPQGLADVAAVQGALAHWEGVLERIGFLDPASPKKLMPRLNQLLNRAALTVDEVHVLRGIARAVDEAAAGRRPGGLPQTPAGRRKQG